MMTKPLMTALATLLFLIPVRPQAAPLEIMIGLPGEGGIIVRQEVQSITDLKWKSIIKQERDFSCGSASLATVFNYYLKSPVREIEIIQTLVALNLKKGTLENVIRRRGFSLLDLKLFAESRGFKATGFRLDFEDLVGLSFPTIVPIVPDGYKHFVVFRGADEERVYLADPSRGNMTQSIEQFKIDWYGFTNVALLVTPPENEEKEGYELALSDLDKIFAGQEGVDSFRYGRTPLRHFIPGEF